MLSKPQSAVTRLTQSSCPNGAPRWMQRTGTEWLFRLLSEPRRLLGRYTRTNLAFVRLVLADRRRA